MKKVVTIQDISCFGKCSLTVALPILSAMGIETAIIPTAILSTHTGGFTGYTFRDLTEDIQSIADHWKSIPLSFEAVYTGYLGSAEQLAIMDRFFDDFGQDSCLFVDPVMGDKGKLYAGFSPEFPLQMAKLCAKADIIVPNLTEACAMLNLPYIEEDYTKGYIEDILYKLRALGAKNVVLTGVSFQPDSLGIALLQEGENQVYYYFNEKIPIALHGTGDLFASCVLGGLMNDLSLQKSLQIAVDFTVKSIQHTITDPDYRYSTKFEECIPALLHMLDKQSN
ncbi:MAG: pyridoxamine kinase [Clostridiales bacterium]|nr:pyridoxamine kinase [Clostridiales bacterium]